MAPAGAPHQQVAGAAVGELVAGGSRSPSRRAARQRRAGAVGRARIADEHLQLGIRRRCAERRSRPAARAAAGPALSTGIATVTSDRHAGSATGRRGSSAARRAAASAAPSPARAGRGSRPGSCGGPRPAARARRCGSGIGRSAISRSAASRSSTEVSCPCPMLIGPGQLGIGGQQVGGDDVGDVDPIARLAPVAEHASALRPSISWPQKIATTPASPCTSWRGP